MDTSRLHDLAVSDSGFVFDPLTGYTFTVNPTGLLVLQSLKQGVTQEDLTAKVEQEFELEGGEDVGRDVSEFVTTLRTMGLVK
jgi:PqqD family protein of HPr-rel-A system